MWLNAQWSTSPQVVLSIEIIKTLHSILIIYSYNICVNLNSIADIFKAAPRRFSPCEINVICQLFKGALKYETWSFNKFYYNKIEKSMTLYNSICCGALIFIWWNDAFRKYIFALIWNLLVFLSFAAFQDH